MNAPEAGRFASLIPMGEELVAAWTDPYWTKVYMVMKAAAAEFGRCDSEQAIRILAAAGVPKDEPDGR